jgi:hypothetical protein
MCLDICIWNEDRNTNFEGVIQTEIHNKSVRPKKMVDLSQ